MDIFYDPFGELMFAHRRFNRIFDGAFASPSFWIEVNRYPEVCNKDCEDNTATSIDNDNTTTESKPLAEPTSDNKALTSTRTDKKVGLWNPHFNISETDKHLVVSAEIPGVDKKDVAVEVRDGVLTVRGEKKKEKRSDSEKFHRVERRFGSFSRSVRLPDGVEPEKHLTAKFENGVLEVLIEKPETPKKEAETKTVIEIA